MPTHGDPGVPVGTVFATRLEAHRAGVHRHSQAGIAGTNPAAESIVLSGGYGDDVDLGDIIYYTGYGGRDATTGKQVADQELKVWNWALSRNRDLGLPVRVLRGTDPSNPFAPAHGYRYDGLYDVVDWSPAEGRDGFRIFHYTLVRRMDQAPLADPQAVTASPGRSTKAVTTVDRDPALTLAIKEIYSYECQISGTVIDTANGRYAEAAHVRPLGRPHDGPDDLSNLLCLCPNDHIRLDRGVIVISPEFEVVSAKTGEVLGALHLEDTHALNPVMVDYHRYVWTELLAR